MEQKKFKLILGDVSKEVNFSPLPNNPLGAFVYFNMSDSTMVDFVLEGARLVNKHSLGRSPTYANLPLLVTAETSTLGMAQELRVHYHRQVEVLTKKARPDDENCISEDYCAITSTKKSTLFFKSDFTTTKKEIVFFDNVCTTGETLRAAAKLFLKLPQKLRFSKAIMLWTEGSDTTPIKEVRISDDYVIPIVSFGHLPIIDVALTEQKPQFVFKSMACTVPTYNYGALSLAAFTSHTGKEAIAAMNMEPLKTLENVPVRIHDACATSELFHSQKCDCREQLEQSLKYIHENGGMVIYLHQEGRGIGFANKLLVYDAQAKQGLDTVDANVALGFPNDIREYVAVKDILQHFKITSIHLMSNNPRKREELAKLGVVVTDTIPVIVKTDSPFCQSYLRAKAERMGHTIPCDTTSETRLDFAACKWNTSCYYDCTESTDGDTTKIMKRNFSCGCVISFSSIATSVKSCEKMKTEKQVLALKKMLITANPQGVEEYRCKFEAEENQQKLREHARILQEIEMVNEKARVLYEMLNC
jgi:GTP cyclohydrolase II